jgi:hypothetical protein
MRILSDVRALDGAMSTLIAFMTSGTYQLPCEAEVKLAAVTGRYMGVPTYGTERLAATRGVDVPELGPVNQFPGELRKAADALRALRQKLGL